MDCAANVVSVAWRCHAVVLLCKVKSCFPYGPEHLVVKGKAKAASSFACGAKVPPVFAFASTQKLPGGRGLRSTMIVTIIGCHGRKRGIPALFGIKNQNFAAGVWGR